MAKVCPPGDRARVLAALRRLPPRTRAVLRLAAAEGLGYEAIAARLGLSVAAVEAHLADALVRVNRDLGGS